MNDDMPWVNLTQEEVEELRNKKYELTEYGKQRLRELLEKQKKEEDINI
jgi:DNA-binding PadR family transcriptional regulator